MNPIIKDALEKAEDAMPDTIPLEERRHPVNPLSPEMLPKVMADYAFDVSHRAQCPPDYVAVAVLCASAALIGRKRLLQPKSNDNWQITPNLWGAAVGGPSAMKSPAIKAGLAALTELEKELIHNAETENKRRQMLAELSKAQEKANKEAAQDKFNKGDTEGALDLLKAGENEYSTTKAVRFIVNDTTVEKLGELLNENPNGLLATRDELSGQLSKLSADDNQAERAFYLECYDGDGSHTTDRIKRGTIRIECCTLSFVGGIQPSRLAPTLSDAISGKGDDGLIQRFQLMVYPEATKGKKWRDIAPNPTTMTDYSDLVNRLYLLEEKEGDEKILRFDKDAQGAFAVWWESLQGEIESPDTAPILQSHYGKMPKTIGALAVIFHLCEGNGNRISLSTLDKVLKWWPYLKSHAIRVYGIVDDQSLALAKKVLTKRDQLTDGFTVRDVRRKGWTGLKTNEQIGVTVDILIDHNYLFEVLPQDTSGAGRRTITYRWNPRLDNRDLSYSTASGSKTKPDHDKAAPNNLPVAPIKLTVPKFKPKS